MGLDLTLMPVDHEDGADGFSHSLLECERRRELFEEIMALRSHPVPARFYTFRSIDNERESHYGDTQETPYGEPLEWVYAKDLLKFKEHIGVRDNYKNAAVWSYLAHLPPKFKIALYWH